MAGRPKAAIRKKAKLGDPNSRLLLEELKAADDDKQLLLALKKQPAFVLRGARDIRALPFPGEHVRQWILSSAFMRTPIERIAAALDQPVEEVVKHYGADIEFTIDVAVADIAQTTIGLAIAGDVPSAILLLKSRAGMGDTLDITATATGDSSVSGPDLVRQILALVDQGRADRPIDVTFKELPPKKDKTDV